MAEEQIFEIEFNQDEKDRQPKLTTSRINTLKIKGNENIPQLKIQLPVAFGGLGLEGKEKYYTPEHLFLAGVSGCFFTTFCVVSDLSHFDYKELKISTRGIIKEIEGENRLVKIIQDTTLKISEGVSEKKAHKILEITERRWPLAKAVKTEIENTFHIIKED